MIASRRRPPSEAGRRVALDRKWRHNVEHYGGRVMLVTLTPPGEDLLPWGDHVRTIDGEPHPQVEWIYALLWNATAQRRASRLMEAAQRAADRWLRRQGYAGQLPRRIGNVRAPQKRGVWHFHELLPAESHWEREWSRTVVRFLDNSWRREQARWSADERMRFVEDEFRGLPVPRGFYGFGYVHKGKPQGKSAGSASRYMARNAAGYMAGNGLSGGGHYVSTRLTRETGVTMARLRACNYLYVRLKLIAEGELTGDFLPGYWSQEWRTEVLRVWHLVTAPSAAP